MTLDNAILESGIRPTIYIGTSAANGYMPACTFAWRIEDGANQLLASSDCLPVRQIAGSDVTKAVHPAIMEALCQIPESIHHALIVTNQSHIVLAGELGIEGRRIIAYRRRGGEKLADFEEWKALDAYCERRGLALSFSPPSEDDQKASMKLVQMAARNKREFLDCGAVE